jgi:hypothetical protein
MNGVHEEVRSCSGASAAPRTMERAVWPRLCDRRPGPEGRMRLGPQSGTPPRTGHARSTHARAPPGASAHSSYDRDLRCGAGRDDATPPRPHGCWQGHRGGEGDWDTAGTRRPRNPGFARAKRAEDPGLRSRRSEVRIFCGAPFEDRVISAKRPLSGVAALPSWGGMVRLRPPRCTRGGYRGGYSR